MLTIQMRTRDDILDLVARAIAVSACALFWWGWLTIGLGIVGSAPGSTKVDASPAIVLAVAAVAATGVFAAGLFITQWLFGVARGRAMAALSYLLAHRRAIVRAVIGVVVALALIFGGVTAFLGVVYLYGFGLSTSATLAVQTAERIDRLVFDLSFEAGIQWAAAFARIYAAVLIVSLGVAAIALGIPRVFGQGRHRESGTL